MFESLYAGREGDEPSREDTCACCSSDDSGSGRLVVQQRELPWRSAWSCRGGLTVGGATKVSEYLVDRASLGDRGDDASPAAAFFTMQNVKGESFFEKICPAHGRVGRWFRIGARHGIATFDLRCFAMSGNAHDIAAMFGIGSEQAEVGDLMLARSGHEHGNAANERLRRKAEHLRAIAEDPFHGEGHETVVEVQTLLSDGRPQDVTE